MINSCWFDQAFVTRDCLLGNLHSRKSCSHDYRSWFSWCLHYEERGAHSLIAGFTLGSAWTSGFQNTSLHSLRQPWSDTRLLNYDLAADVQDFADSQFAGSHEDQTHPQATIHHLLSHLSLRVCFCLLLVDSLPNQTFHHFLKPFVPLL